MGKIFPKFVKWGQTRIYVYSPKTGLVKEREHKDDEIQISASEMLDVLRSGKNG